MDFEPIITPENIINMLKVMAPIFFLSLLVPLSMRIIAIFKQSILFEEQPPMYEPQNDEPVTKSGSGYLVRMEDGTKILVSHADMYPNDLIEPEKDDNQ